MSVKEPPLNTHLIASRIFDFPALLYPTKGVNAESSKVSLMSDLKFRIEISDSVCVIMEVVSVGLLLKFVFALLKLTE